MARINRRDVPAEDEVPVVHCSNRCVRRRFLCGDDSSREKTLITYGSGFGIDWNSSHPCLV